MVSINNKSTIYSITTITCIGLGLAVLVLLGIYYPLVLLGVCLTITTFAIGFAICLLFLALKELFKDIIKAKERKKMF